MASLNDRLAALQAMSTQQLRVEWARVIKEPAPAIPADLLLRGLAYRMQERVHGGLDTAVRRRISRLVKQLDRHGEIQIEREVVLKPGTRLARDWHGRTHHVLILENGFLFQERRYSSLTKVAQDITGAAWSGPRFFGLKRRPKAFAEAANG